MRRNGVSILDIASATQSSKNTVKKYLRLSEQKGLSLESLIDMEDHKLEQLFAEPEQKSKDRHEDLKRLFPQMSSELQRTGVTRWVLWGEYKSLHPDGYSYSQFCDYYKQWSDSQSATMHIEHRAGEKCFIDFSGKKLQVVDRETGEIQDVEVYIATLGYSQLTYVEAVANQKKDAFICATENALHYFGGVPRVLVPDNLKSAITKADKYEADVNEDFLDFANHYKTAVLPARSRKPKDKALVEKSVSIVYSRIFAPLRNQVFFSIAELNKVIKELLEKHNQQHFQKEQISRRERFEQEEVKELLELPKSRYELKQYKKAKVMKNCHIQLDKRYYSVPFRYIGKNVKIIYTPSHVQVFYKGERIAVHSRIWKAYAYSTVKEHLPSSHQFVSEWSPEKFITWAGRINPVVKQYIENILEQKLYPEQAYRSCVGILSYEKKVGKERLINAIERATFYQVYNYKAVKKILEGKLDMLDHKNSPEKQETLPFHENIRGAENYK